MSPVPGFRLTPTAQADAFTAEIDLSHPFYFDHPLGHLPGLLLLDIALASLEHAQRARGVERPWFVRVDTAFRAIAALRAPLRAEVRVLGDPAVDQDRQTWVCRLFQDTRLRAETRVETMHGVRAPPLARTTEQPAPFVPLDRRSVRKSVEGNVFLAAASRGGWPIRPAAAPAGTLAAQRHGWYGPVYLTECFLQLCRIQRPQAFATANGVPASREILITAGSRLPRPVVALEALTLTPGREADGNRSAPSRAGAVRRHAELRSSAETIGAFYCDALKI